MIWLERRVETIIPLLVALVCLSFLFPQATLPSKFYGYGAVAAVYGFAIITVAYFDNDHTISAPSWLVISISAIWVIMLAHVASSANVGSLLRGLTFVLITGLNIFYLPKFIQPHHFYWVLSRISAGVVLVGIIPLVGGPSQIAFADLSLWEATLHVPGVNLQPITSIFWNPNTLGFVCLFGVLASAAEYTNTKNRVAMLFLSLNTLGLVLSNFRTGFVVAMGTYVVFLSYRYGRLGVIFTCMAGTSVAVLVLGMVLGIIPGPEVLERMTLNGREEVWRVGYSVWTDSPIFGYGFVEGNAALQPSFPSRSNVGVHNSYLRMFIATGAIGGGAYLFLTTRALISSALHIASKSDLMLFLFLVGFSIVQVFNGLTMFGLATNSMFLSLILGLAIQNIG